MEMSMMKRFNPVKAIISATIGLLSFAAFSSLGSEAKGQYYPECFMVSEFGEVLDLSSICGQPAPEPTSEASDEESAEEVAQEPDEESSTYIDTRESENLPNATSSSEGSTGELYRGYQDVLRGSTLQNRQTFRDALSDAESR
jgi:hypothetical protein